VKKKHEIRGNKDPWGWRTDFPQWEKKRAFMIMNHRRGFERAAASGDRCTKKGGGGVEGGG